MVDNCRPTYDSTNDAGATRSRSSAAVINGEWCRSRKASSGQLPHVMAGPIYFVVKVSANRQTATTYHWQNAWWTWRIPLTLLTAPKCYVRMSDTTTVQSKPSCQVNRAIVGLKSSSFFTARLQACTVWRSVCLSVSLPQVKIL